MKNTIKHLFLLTGVFFSTGCTSTILDIVDLLEPNRIEDDWENKGHLRKLMNHPKKELLSENQKIIAAKSICKLKHLKKDVKNIQLQAYTKPFCKLEKNDKIYFYDWCMDCGGGHYVATSYLLVRDDKPFAAVQIETKYSKELGRTIPIVERLH